MTIINLDKTTKFILAMIAIGLFLNAVPKLSDNAYALDNRDTINVNITKPLKIKLSTEIYDTINIDCKGCN